MDFHGLQDDARQRTQLLVVLVLVAALAVVAILGGLTAWGLALAVDAEGRPLLTPDQRFGLSAGVALLSAAGIALGSWIRTCQLGHGGPAVAQSLGGRLVAPQSRDAADRRLLNIVEEMSLAAGLPVPQVYVLEQESGINAFAAGLTPSDAVVAVTRGALDKLNRDELQGVIAHECSHILSGDMRLNMRLTGLIFGLAGLAFIGSLLLRSMRGVRGSGKNGAQIIIVLLLAGVALWLLGLLGSLLARLVTAAVSRQREYLADAAAVQFTRNPLGLAAALKRISAGQSRIRHGRSGELAHFFLAPPWSAALWATHPPIAERIRRLDPAWPGRASSVAPEASSAAAPAAGAAPLAGLAGAAGAAGRAPAASPPTTLHDAAHDPYTARALAVLLVVQAGATGALRLPAVIAAHDADLAQLVAHLHHAHPQLRAQDRLGLLARCLPALRTLSAQQRADFLDLLAAVIAADGTVTLAEYACARLLRHHLQRAAGSVAAATSTPGPRPRVGADVAVLYAALAHAGAPGQPAQAAAAFAAGLLALRAPSPLACVAPDDCGPAQLDPVLDRLIATPLEARRRILRGAAAIVRHDGVVAAAEQDLLRLSADLLDCPVPPAEPPGAGHAALAPAPASDSAPRQPVWALRHVCAALPALVNAVVMAVVFARALTGPSDPAQLRTLCVIIIMQALLMHAGAFLAHVSALQTRLAAVIAVLGIGCFYSIFGLAFSLMCKTWLPLLIVVISVASELPRLLVGRIESDEDRSSPGARTPSAMIGFVLINYLAIGFACFTLAGQHIGFFEAIRRHLQLTPDQAQPFLIWGLVTYLMQALIISIAATGSAYLQHLWNRHPQSPYYRERRQQLAALDLAVLVLIHIAVCGSIALGTRHSLAIVLTLALLAALTYALTRIRHHHRASHHATRDPQR